MRSRAYAKVSDLKNKQIQTVFKLYFYVILINLFQPMPRETTSMPFTIKIADSFCHFVMLLIK